VTVRVTASPLLERSASLLDRDDDPLVLRVLLDLDQRALALLVPGQLEDPIEVDALLLKRGRGLPGYQLRGDLDDPEGHADGALRIGPAALECPDLDPDFLDAGRRFRGRMRPIGG